MNNTENKLAQLVKDVLAYLPWGEVTEHTPGEMARYLISNGVGFEKEPPRRRPASEPLTNADHIRCMTDDELAEWIRNGISSDACDYCDYNNGYCDGSPCRGKAEADIIVEWLQQPYKEDE